MSGLPLSQVSERAGQGVKRHEMVGFTLKKVGWLKADSRRDSHPNNS